MHDFVDNLNYYENWSFIQPLIYHLERSANLHYPHLSKTDLIRTGGKLDTELVRRRYGVDTEKV